MDWSNGNKFKFVIPADLQKGEDGEWRVRGLASTANRDAQGEILLPEGIDLSPIDQKKGVLNWNHEKGPQNLIGILDGYKKTPEGLFIEGRLLKNHEKAKAVYQIMSSFEKGDRGRMGLSVEGIIRERGGKDGKVIKKCQINAVALTMNPVNQDTFVDLVKSMSAPELEIEFPSELNEELLPEDPTSEESEVKFSTKQVIALMEMQKAMSVGSEYANTDPKDLSGGAALAQEDLDKKPKDANCESCKESKKLCKCMKSLKKGDVTLYKSAILEIMEKLHVLHPELPKSALWEIFKDRLNKRFGKPDSNN